MQFMIGFTCVAIGACVAGSSFAEENRWYLGASGGVTSSSIRDAEFLAVARSAYTDIGLDQQDIATTHLDDRDSTWSVSAGFRILRYLALEAAYVDLGTTSVRYTGTVGRSDGRPLPPSATSSSVDVRGELDVSSTGFGLKALGILPLGERFDLHAHAGTLRFKTKLHLVAPGSALALWKFYRADERESNELFYGIGAGYSCDEHWALSVDWQRFAGLGFEGGSTYATGYSTRHVRADTESLTLGVKFSF